MYHTTTFGRLDLWSAASPADLLPNATLSSSSIAAWAVPDVKSIGPGGGTMTGMDRIALYAFLASVRGAYQKSVIET